MPDFHFAVTGMEAAQRGLAPLLQFNLEITNQPAEEKIHTALLQAQIQIQSPLRSYNEGEKEKLNDLFGTPDRWGQTLRNRLWGICQTTVKGFSHRTETAISLPCTFDLNVAATKYFYALEGGEVPLLFLFSGSIFYETGDGRLQVTQISWEKECTYRMPVALWQEMMQQHFPNCAWLYLQRDVFEQFYAYKRNNGFTSWDATMAALLRTAEQNVEVPS